MRGRTARGSDYAVITGWRGVGVHLGDYGVITRLAVKAFSNLV